MSEAGYWGLQETEANIWPVLLWLFVLIGILWWFMRLYESSKLSTRRRQLHSTDFLGGDVHDRDAHDCVAQNCVPHDYDAQSIGEATSLEPSTVHDWFDRKANILISRRPQVRKHRHGHR